MATLNPKTWPRWAWLLIAAALVLPVIIGAHTFGSWPFDGPVVKVVEPSPPALALQRDVTALSGRLSTVEGTAASKQDLAEIKAEMARLKAAVSALAEGDKKRARGITTGSVK